jgi:hypothetical protein
MRSFPSEKALVTAYWRKLARFNGARRAPRSGVHARHMSRRLRMRQRHVSHGHSAAELLRPPAQSHPNS